MNAVFELGREAFGTAGINWTSDTIKAALMDLATPDNAVKTITGATNANPIVVTATSHGFTNGDLVCVMGVGGNLAANGFWKISNVTTNTFEIDRPDGVGAVGSAAYTSGGVAINYGPSTSSKFYSDFDAGVVGTPQTLTSPTDVAGVFSAANPTFTAVTGNPVKGILLYKDTGTSTTSRIIAISTGNHIATCSKAAASSATSIDVEPLAAGIPTSTVLTFSNGATATLSGAASAGDRTLTVSALAAGIAVASRAFAPATGSGLPITPNGGSITIQWNGSGIFKL